MKPIQPSADTIASQFDPDTIASLVDLALEQSQCENALRLQLKQAVERRDVKEVFRLSELFTGSDGFIAATLAAECSK